MNAATDERMPWLDTLFARSYARHRQRYVELWLLVSAFGILLLAWPSQFWTEHPLWGPGGGDAPAFLVSMASATAIVVLFVVPWTLRVAFRPIVLFLRGEPVDPTDVWFAAVRRLPVAGVTFTAAFCVFGNIPTLVAVGRPRGFDGLDYLGGWLVACLITAAAGAFFVLAWEIAFRPLLREVQPLLPPDFDGGTSWLTLTRRSALASASAMAYTGAAVGSLVAGSEDREHVLVITVLATIGASVTFGGAITVLVSHSIFMRLSELKAALVRIGERDYRVRVAVRAGDELDEAAASLNRMAERLEHEEAELRASRARLASVADAERRRMERDLRLRVLARLRQVRQDVTEVASELPDVPALHRLCERVRVTTADAMLEIHRLARGVYPAELTSGGLEAALEAAGQRAAVPVSVRSDGVGRLDPVHESSVYFTCNEAVQNAAKHAGPDACVTIDLARDNGRLTFVVSDNGQGFEAADVGLGLENMRDRVRAVGGDLMVGSAPGSGTTVRGWVPA
ncbi:sensor histidine kinase [Nocardioides antri]|uniref:histidine kinase n=1 Tax=Nocardioides antri TaxID=2607659 RepID=A0A5B1M9R3_9ACTN|nr:ATP-binding protein [Nocardioides antri]KAA1429308.1 HAMP domain-containing protein [Nocardioides antri]